MKDNNNALVIFHDGSLEIDVKVSPEENTVWLTLNQIASLFEKDKSTVSRHIKNIFSEGELEYEATVAKNATAQIEGQEKSEDL